MSIFSRILLLTCFSQVLFAQEYLDQGVDWTTAKRNRFYLEDQGSRIMPYSWSKALRDPDGQLFFRDSGKRFGLLPNPESAYGLPVGFFVVSDKKNTDLSMNCAACHTRQITVDGQEYRIDGGPAFVDFHKFFVDLFKAVEYTLSNKDALKKFAQEVGTSSTGIKTALRKWYTMNYLVYGSTLPSEPWGVGRLDALSNIMNRVTGAMIGKPPSFLISENVVVADFPVRFPFLWNASRQDLTQWTGSSLNGNTDYALARNSGEVCGVWGMIHPRGNNFLADNTTNYYGLMNIEALIRKIGPPAWPWEIDVEKATQGAKLYEDNCSSCHGIKPGKLYDTWSTPVMVVGTDTWYWKNLSRTAPFSGSLTGRANPETGMIMPPNDASALALTGLLNVSALTQKFPWINLNTVTNDSNRVPGSYESRVLEGIWASAPYLHNGSVPSLAELLKPASQRIKVFQVGPAYDLKNVGLAQPQPDDAVTSTFNASDDLDSGDSNLGHEYGTDLDPNEKEILLEYLKTL
jgi:hypothetical protein